MKIATFNINGIKARIETVPLWLQASKPDVAVLQEIKSVDEGFPREIFEDLGYRVETHGQKGFNGVAILSKLPLEDVTRGLPGDDVGRTGALDRGDGDRARARSGSAASTCPTGTPRRGRNTTTSSRGWSGCALRALDLLATEEPVVLLGDYNVIPQAEDAAKPAAWVTDALFLPESRAAFRRLLNLGFTDALLARNPNPGYTFWDYQAGAWERNNGIRIDHVLLSPQAADLLDDAGIEKSLRGGEKPSDHVPVWVELAA